MEQEEENFHENMQVGSNIEDVFKLKNKANIKAKLKLFKEKRSEKRLEKRSERRIDNIREGLKIMKISAYALEKMFIMAQEVFKIFNRPVEVYSLSVGNNEIIEDILIPFQSVSSVYVYIDSKNIYKLIPQIRKENLTILGWNHSHANFSVFFSGTDDNNQNIILSETSNFAYIKGIHVKYAYGITVNVKRDLFGIITTQFPTGEIVNEKANFTIIGNLPEEWNEEKLRLEIFKELEQKTSLRNAYLRNYNYNFNEKTYNSNDQTYNSNDQTYDQTDNSKLNEYHLLKIDKYLKINMIDDPKIKELLQNYQLFLNDERRKITERQENKI